MQPGLGEMRVGPGDEYWGWAMNDAGYSWCRLCEEYHRLPECDVRGEVILNGSDSSGRPELLPGPERV